MEMRKKLTKKEMNARREEKRSIKRARRRAGKRLVAGHFMTAA